MQIIITGGAGFIGCNTAERFLRLGHEVIIFDSLSRPGAESNLHWLAEQGEFVFIRSDVRDAEAFQKLFREQHDVDVVLHLAGQVAVTLSVQDPKLDFEVNAWGTFNLLEAIRQAKLDPVFIFSSTNKVYGELDGLVVEEARRYKYADARSGISEDQPLDFHSPYGCSKGTADQYVHDYARIYGLRTVVFRQSCIYGPRQLGLEDQGWVAWFIIAAVLGRPITIFGNGKQVRDLLFIDDLVDAYCAAIDRIEVAQGQAYNIGGGPSNTLSVWNEFGELLESLIGRRIPVSFEDFRPGDQLVYVSDISKSKRDLNWQPQVELQQGIRRLFDWVSENRDLFD